jgi:hypothetical protein
VSTDYAQAQRKTPKIRGEQLPFERMEREKWARDLGYHGKFGDSGAYQFTFFQVILNTHWDE